MNYQSTIVTCTTDIAVRTGYGSTCKGGIPTMLYGPGVKITDDTIPSVTKQPETMNAAVEAGRLLGARLRKEHYRLEVTRNMQQKLMSMFGHSA